MSFIERAFAVCRTCLNPSDVMYNLFGENCVRVAEDDISAVEFLNSCFHLAMEEYDESSPSRICNECYGEIQRIYTFKTKCEHSHIVLTQLRDVQLKLSNKVKHNPIPSPDAINKKPIKIIENQLLNSTVTKVEESSNAKYVEILDDDDPSNVFERLGGLDPATEMDVDNVIVKEEDTSDGETGLKSVLKDSPIQTEEVVSSPVTTNAMEQENFECPACPYVHLTESGLKKHMIGDHMIGNECTICKKFVNENPLDHFSFHLMPNVPIEPPAPAIPPVPIVAQATVIPPVPIAPPAPVIPPVPIAPPAPVIPRVPIVQPAPVIPRVPVVQPAPVPIVPTFRNVPPAQIIPSIDFEDFIPPVALVERKVKCDYCLKVLKNASDLEEHINEHHKFPNNDTEYTSVGNNYTDSIETDQLFSEIIEQVMDDEFNIDGVADNSTLFFDSDLNVAHHQIVASTPKQNFNKPDVFHCSECSESFNQVELLNSHLRTHANVKPFRCGFCLQTFKYQHNLDVHLRFKHCQECKGDKSVECDSCGSKFRGVKRHECDVCNKMFSTEATLNRHRKVHGLDSKFKCPLCPKFFNYKQILQLHMKEKHAGANTNVQLSGTTRENSTQSTVQENHNKTNATVNGLECNICKLQFRYEESLSRHKKHFHPNNLPTYQCNVCLKTFRSQDDLTKHYRMYHTNDKPFGCDVCSERFADQFQLGAHKVLKHDRRCVEKQHFACNQCKMVFTTSALLEAHRKMHNSNHERKTYKCSVCGIMFHTTESLQQHVERLHANNGEVPESHIQSREESMPINNDAVVVYTANSFDPVFLGNNQIVTLVQAPDVVMTEIFDESSIEVA